MAIREVIRMGHPTLRLKAQPVSKEEILSDDFKALIKDMFDTMAEEDGIGIAAPQINISKQVAIIGVPKDNPRYPDAEEGEEVDENDEDDFDIIVVVNPKVTVTNPEKRGFWEGCLSVPGLRGYVERPSGVKIEFLDLEGNEQVIEADDFTAVIFQHEIDHLEGILYVDRVEDKTKLSYIEEYMEFNEEEEE